MKNNDAVMCPYELGKHLAKQAGTVRDILGSTAKGGLAGAGIGGLAGLGVGGLGALVAPGNVEHRWLLPIIAALYGSTVGGATGAGLGANYGVVRTGVRDANRESDERR